MELAFSTKKLRTICENEHKAKDAYGSEVATKLIRRLADLRAATNISDVVVGNPRIENTAKGFKMIIDLQNNYSMVFCANHPANPTLENGNIDWSRVSRVKILLIEDDNE